MKTPTLTEETYVLALDTSTDALGVALWHPESGGFEVFHEEAFRSQSSSLHPKIIDILVAKGIEMTDVGLIVCTNGPGSFTGVRIGLAAAQGLSKALGIDFVGVSTLEVASEPNTTVWLPAIRGEVYLQQFDAEGVATCEAMVAPIEEAVKDLKDGDILRVCGYVELPEGSPKVEKLKVSIDPLVLAKKGWEKYRASGAEPVKPIYLSQLKYRKKDDIQS